MWHRPKGLDSKRLPLAWASKSLTDINLGQVSSSSPKLEKLNHRRVTVSCENRGEDPVLQTHGAIRAFKRAGPAPLWHPSTHSYLSHPTCQSTEVNRTAQHNSKVKAVQDVMGVQQATQPQGSRPSRSPPALTRMALSPSPPTYPAPTVHRLSSALVWVNPGHPALRPPLEPPLWSSLLQFRPSRADTPARIWTYCAPPAPGSCRIYGFLWHSTPTRCFPECSCPPSPPASPPAAPGCCCKGPGPGRGRGSSPMARGDW